jgi:UDP-glucose 4-epimerase
LETASTLDGADACPFRTLAVINELDALRQATVEELAARYEGRNVMITGGLGFIGSNLARALVPAGAEVLVVDSLVPEYGGNLFNLEGVGAGLRVNISDVRDEHSLRQLVRDKDVLFNLAGQTSHLDSMEDPFTDLEINARSQLAILEACRRENRSAKVVFASTRQVYGRPRYLPVDEAHPIEPVDVNGINKAAGERYHLLYGEVYGLRVTALRLTNTYGPRMRVRDARQTFLGIWLKSVLLGDELEVYGDGSQRRDFTYVDDAVRAFLLAGSSDEANGEAFNLGDTQSINLRELAELLVQLNGSGSYRLVPFPRQRQQIDIGDYYTDFSKIRSRLGWEPTVSLAEGLARSLDFLRAHGASYWGAG